MMNQCDIVIVEGDSKTSAPKIEVFLAANNSEPMAQSDPRIQAVVTEDDVNVSSTIWGRCNFADSKCRVSFGPGKVKIQDKDSRKRLQ